MNQEQKQTVLQEIRKWKESKLLPAEYCDFLMNLYMEGESFPADQEQGTRGARGGAGAPRGRLAARLMMILGSLLLFLIFAFNFTSFPKPMQIVSPLLGTVICYFLAWRNGRNHGLARVTWLALASLLLTASGYFFLKITDQLHVQSAILQMLAMLCALWTLTGLMGRSRLIVAIGWGGLLLLFAAFLEKSVGIGTSPYGVQHFYWLIPVLVSLLLALGMGRKRVYVAPVFLFYGILAVFGPDVRLLFFGGAIDLFLQAMVFLKLALLVSLLIVFRLEMKSWMKRLSV